MSHPQRNRITLFLIATFFVSCSFQKNRTSETENEIETVWTRPNVAHTLDWNLAQKEEDHQHAALVMEGLARVQDTSSGFVLENVLAEKIESLSLTRWRIRLANREWSDGTPLIAAHFLDAWKHHLAKLPKHMASPLDSISGVPAFRAGLQPFERCAITSPEPRTIEIALGQIDREFPYKLSHPQTWPRLPGPTTALSPTLGAFRLLEWTPKLMARYERDPRHPSYQGAKNSLRIEAVVEPASRIDRFVSGESQIVEAPPESWSVFRGSPALRIVKGAETLGLLFVSDTRPWTEPTFRKALFAALDFDEIYRLLDHAVIPETGFGSASRARESRDTKKLEALLKGRARVSLSLCEEEDPLRNRMTHSLAAQLNLWAGSAQALEVTLTAIPHCDLRVVEGKGRGTDTLGLLSALLMEARPKQHFPILSTRLARLADTSQSETARTRLQELESWLTEEQGLYLTLGVRARGLLATTRIGEIARSPLDFWDLRDTKL